MKKIGAVLLALSLLLSFAACGGTKYLPETGIGGEPAGAEATPPQTAAPAATSAPIETAAPSGFRFAADYAEVYASLNASWSGVAEDTEAPMVVNEAADAGGVDYSGTNVQVSGVDEGDIVKTDGEYIYVLNGQYTLTVLRADGENSAVVSQTAVGRSSYTDGEHHWSSESKSPREMFVSDDILVVISDYYSSEETYFEALREYESENYACVDFYDVSDPAHPTLTASLGQDGSLLGSRLLDGRLYLVTQYWVWAYDEGDPATYVPRVYHGGETRILPVDCIAICAPSTEYVVVCAYDLAAGALTASQSVLGAGSTLYMSEENLYVLGSRWEQTELRTYAESVYTVTEYRNGSNTEICRFDLSGGLSLAANGTVPGFIDSQFSADEYDGHLRIVTTRNDSLYRIYTDETYGFSNSRWEDRESGNDLYILDLDLNVVGSLTDLAPEELVYSARFDGEIAYFTTFRTVDPLFTVDCGDPANPVLLSALKISGFSEYLHPWSEGRLFGFGREADEETGWAEGLKLVMFDTTNKMDVTAAHTYALDAGYSEALYNHRAFFIDSGKNIVGFVGEGDYYVFSYDDGSGFTELSHFWFDTKEYNVRGFWIGGTAYIVGQEELMVLDMDTWAAPTPVNIMANE